MNFNKAKNGLRKAFTLVELIIVIAVIAIIAIFVVPNFTNVLGDTQVTQVKNDTKNLSNVVTAYIQEVGAVPVANGGTEVTSVKDSKGNYQGISTSEFKDKAVKDKTADYYVLDMDLLTKNVGNVDNPNDIIAAKLSSMPSTSAIVDVTHNTANTVKPSKSIKNTSVIYVIDSDLRVYAVHNKALKKNSTAIPAIVDGHIDNSYVVLNPANAHDLDDRKVGTDDADGQSHKIFKVPFKSGAKVAATLVANDTNYR